MSKLYILATPIGNLADITYRAIEILSNSDLILAEDTRKTKILLSKYKISKPLMSFHDHNEDQKLPEVISKLKQGLTVTLLSDAGTPTLADPGFKLVRQSVAEGITISPIPGPMAAIAALSASGLPTDQFFFLGYFPKKKSKQNDVLNLISLIQKAKPTTIIFYESPYRIKKTLAILSEKFPEGSAVIARELTKIHEDFQRGSLKELANQKITEKGEFTLLLRQ